MWAVRGRCLSECRIPRRAAGLQRSAGASEACFGRRRRKSRSSRWRRPANRPDRRPARDPGLPRGDPLSSPAPTSRASARCWRTHAQGGCARRRARHLPQGGAPVRRQQVGLLHELRRPGGDRRREHAAAQRAATKSLQQQTATADVLKVISRSTFDLSRCCRRWSNPPPICAMPISLPLPDRRTAYSIVPRPTASPRSS